MVFLFLVGNFISRDRNWFFGRHFVIVYPIFDFLLYLGSFESLYQWPAFHRQIHSGKYFSELGSIGTPPLTTNGSAEGLDHLRAFFFYKNHPGHGDQGWTNLSKLGPYTSIDEPLFMAMKIPASVAPVFLDEIYLISLI